MGAVSINLLDGADVSQMHRLLHLKVVVFLHKEEVDLLTIPAEKQRGGHKNWSQAGLEETCGFISAFPPVVGRSDLPPR